MSSAKERTWLPSVGVAFTCFLALYFWRANMWTWTWRMREGFFAHDYGMFSDSLFDMFMQRAGGFVIHLMTIGVIHALVARAHQVHPPIPTVRRSLRIGVMAGLWGSVWLVPFTIVGLFVGGGVAVLLGLGPEGARFAWSVVALAFLAILIARLFPAIPVALPYVHLREGWQRVTKRMTQGRRTRYFLFTLGFLLLAFWSNAIVYAWMIGFETIPQPMEPTFPALPRATVLFSVAVGVVIDGLIATAWAFLAQRAYEEAPDASGVFE